MKCFTQLLYLSFPSGEQINAQLDQLIKYNFKWLWIYVICVRTCVRRYLRMHRILGSFNPTKWIQLSNVAWRLSPTHYRTTLKTMSIEHPHTVLYLCKIREWEREIEKMRTKFQQFTTSMEYIIVLHDVQCILFIYRMRRTVKFIKHKNNHNSFGNVDLCKARIFTVVVIVDSTTSALSKQRNEKESKVYQCWRKEHWHSCCCSHLRFAPFYYYLSSLLDRRALKLYRNCIYLNKLIRWFCSIPLKIFVPVYWCEQSRGGINADTALFCFIINDSLNIICHSTDILSLWLLFISQNCRI